MGKDELQTNASSVKSRKKESCGFSTECESRLKPTHDNMLN